MSPVGPTEVVALGGGAADAGQQVTEVACFEPCGVHHKILKITTKILQCVQAGRLLDSKRASTQD